MPAMRIARGLGLGILVLLSIGATANAGVVAEPDKTADQIELAFDDAGVLHLVSHITSEGTNLILHRSRTPDGFWSQAETLAPDFAIAGPDIELVRRPDGRLCLFFDAWRDGTNVDTEGIFLRCRENGAWAVAEQVDGGVGVTASFDGAFGADGTAHALSAEHGTIAYGDVVLPATGLDAGFPSLAIDGDGTLHAAWAAFGNPIGVLTSRSTDGGATWTEPESFTGVARVDVPYDLVSDRAGNVHALLPGSPSVYRKWSGGAWSKAVELPTGIGPKRLGVGPDGLAIVAWAEQETIYLLRQRADGSWSSPEPIDTATTPPHTLAVAADAAGSIVVGWADADGVTVAGAALPSDDFASSVPSPFDITLDPVIVAQSAAIAAGVLILVPLPAQLFNHTIEANYGRLSGAFGRLRRRLAAGPTGKAAFWRGPLGVFAFFLVSAVITAFLDPTLAPTVKAAATIAGLFVGLVVVAVAFTLPSAILHRIRSRGRARVEVRPLALPIAIASVAVSRLTAFQPGYLYGLLAGVELQGEPRRGDLARGVAISSWWVLALVLGAWFALVPIRAMLADPEAPLWALAGQAALATVVVSGLESLLFGLLPLAITPGGVLFRERRRMWAVLMAVSAFAFFHVLVNPTSGYLVDSSRVPLITTVALFVGFSALTALTWLYFRLRPTRDAHAPEGPGSAD